MVLLAANPHIMQESSPLNSSASVCRLCEQEATLRNSHIIPEFLYSELYEIDGRFKIIGKAGKPIIQTVQKGLREKLLCHECEQRFSKWERTFADLYQGGLKALRTETIEMIEHRGRLKFSRLRDAEPFAGPGLPDALWVEAVDYSAIKLFQMSLIWRMGVSRSPFFGDVSLGPLEESLRQMLIAEDPGPVGLYACQMRWIHHEGRLLSDVMTKPKRFKCFDQMNYLFFTTGLRFQFCVSKRHHPEPFTKVWCVKPGEPYFWCVSEIKKLDPMLLEELIHLHGFVANPMQQEA